MIVLSNSESQTVGVGDSILFDTVRLKTGCTECHRPGTGSVKMRTPGVYDISFTGNATVADGYVSMVATISDDPLPETQITSFVASESEYNNVSFRTAIANCCGDYSRVRIVNNGETEFTLAANSAFVVSRREQA